MIGGVILDEHQRSSTKSRKKKRKPPANDVRKKLLIPVKMNNAYRKIKFIPPKAGFDDSLLLMFYNLFYQWKEG